MKLYYRVALQWLKWHRSGSSGIALTNWQSIGIFWYLLREIWFKWIFIDTVTLQWHSGSALAGEWLLTVNWYSIVSQLAFQWQLIDTPLAVDWHSIGSRLAFQWQVSDTPLAVKWHSIGSQLSFHRQSIDSTRVTFHWQSIGIPLAFHWQSISI